MFTRFLLRRFLAERMQLQTLGEATLGRRGWSLLYRFGRVMSGPYSGLYLSGVPTKAALEALNKLKRGEVVDIHLMHRHKSGSYKPSRLALIGGALVMLFDDRSESALSSDVRPMPAGPGSLATVGAATGNVTSDKPYVFLDTEFTSLRRPELLSLGMVDQFGAWFYGEIDLLSAPASFTRGIGRFPREHVIPQFGRVPGSGAVVDVIAKRAVRWLDALQATVIFVAYDFAADFDLLEELLGVSTDKTLTSLKPTHVGYLLDDADGERAAAHSYLESARMRLGPHHALAEAFALRARFNAVHG